MEEKEGGKKIFSIPKASSSGLGKKKRKRERRGGEFFF